METWCRLNAFLTSRGLDGTVAGAEVDSFIMTRADQLHFQMVKVTKPLLDKHTTIAKLAFGIGLHLAVYLAELFNAGDLFDPHTATTCRRLNEDGRFRFIFVCLDIKDVLGDLFRLHFIVNGSGGAGNGGDAEFVGDPLGVDLVTKIPDDLPAWPDKGKGPVADGYPTGKPIILREESIARMNGRTQGVIRHGQDIIGIGVAGYPPCVLGRTVELVALYMFGVTIGICIDDHIIKIQVLTGLHDTDSNFSAISDEHFALHEKPLNLSFVYDNGGLCSGRSQAVAGERCIKSAHIYSSLKPYSTPPAATCKVVK